MHNSDINSKNYNRNFCICKQKKIFTKYNFAKLNFIALRAKYLCQTPECFLTKWQLYIGNQMKISIVFACTRKSYCVIGVAKTNLLTLRLYCEQHS